MSHFSAVRGRDFCRAGHAWSPRRRRQLRHNDARRRRVGRLRRTDGRPKAAATCGRSRRGRSQRRLRACSAQLRRAARGAALPAVRLRRAPRPEQQRAAAACVKQRAKTEQGKAQAQRRTQRRRVSANVACMYSPRPRVQAQRRYSVGDRRAGGSRPVVVVADAPVRPSRAAQRRARAHTKQPGAGAPPAQASPRQSKPKRHRRGSLGVLCSSFGGAPALGVLLSCGRRRSFSGRVLLLQIRSAARAGVIAPCSEADKAPRACFPRVKGK